LPRARCGQSGHGEHNGKNQRCESSHASGFSFAKYLIVQSAIRLINPTLITAARARRMGSSLEYTVSLAISDETPNRAIITQAGKYFNAKLGLRFPTFP
jgi:hypothetical protein